MQALDGLREVTAVLGECGIEHPHKEAELILTQCLGMEKIVLYRDNPVLSLVQREEMHAVLERRRRREPIQYIIGHVDFLDLEIQVGPGVLVPRPETELMAAEVIRSLRERLERTEADATDRGDCRSLRILDLCTGSGCLALAFARAFPASEVIGVDVSEKALEYARRNAGINGIANISFLGGHLYEPLDDRTFDIIVSNPPYIRRGDIASLQSEIRDWEPLEALDGGEDGLRFYREILSGAPAYLVRNGFLFLELGQGEAQDVLTIAQESGFRSYESVRDLAGIERFLRLSFGRFASSS
jgi:release factor glutamine methyltransferase